MVLGGPVIVHEDRGRPDIRPLADVRVAYVGQVRHLGPLAHRRVLQFHIGTYVRVRAYPRTRAQPGERPDARTAADLGRLADRVENRGIRRHRGIPEQAAGPDPGAGPDRRLPLQVGSRQYLRTRRQGDVDINPGGRRVHDRDPGQHPGLEQPVVAGPAHPRELDLVVHALDFTRVIGDDGA